jgi:hypothetical protein
VEDVVVTKNKMNENNVAKALSFSETNKYWKSPECTLSVLAYRDFSAWKKLVFLGNGQSSPSIIVR